MPPFDCQRYLETLAKNLDDSIERLESDTGKVSGRAARIKRRMELMLKELQGVQVHLDYAMKYRFSSICLGCI